MAYFLIAVATEDNLQKCVETNLAGFTDSINGYWAFVDVDAGDYVSFLHGARVYNLYRVEKKVAIENPDEMGPWEPIKLSSRKYSFPFRLLLKPVRRLSESMIRPEFSYIAENLLLRGGYRKTHFQADEITLYNVSSLGVPLKKNGSHNVDGWKTFTPKISFSRELASPPRVFPMREIILQSIVRKSIEKRFMRDILDVLGIGGYPDDFEVLGEKALPSGHADLLIKPRHPIGFTPKILVEVKLGDAGRKEVTQLKTYIKEAGDEAVGGILIARSFKRNVPEDPSIIFAGYEFKGVSEEKLYTHEELVDRLKLNL